MASSMVDDDTRRTVESGRATLGAMLSTAQRELQKVFIVFVIGFIGTFYALRLWVWDWLKAMTISNMDESTSEATVIIITTPFEVILLQAKIGIIVGILIIIPILVYLSRQELRERGVWPEISLARWKIVSLGILSIALFIGGVTYAYRLFFPIMFDFLATQAISVGVAPTYSIVDWTEFMILLTLSFGLAAQLPMIMSGLSYGNIVQYETFRDKWRYAVLGIFLFGALFSPPDPFTQIMWAIPLIALYVLSLGLAKMVTNVRRSNDAGISTEFDIGLKRTVLVVGAVAGVAFVTTAVVIAQGGLFFLFQEINPLLPEMISLSEPIGLQAYIDANGLFGIFQVSLVAALTIALIPVIVFTTRVLLRPVHPPVRFGDPLSIDLDALDVEGVRVAPIEVFSALSEDEALKHASTAIDGDDAEKAHMILERFDEAQESAESSTGDDGDQTTDDDHERSISNDDTPITNPDPTGAVQDTATGMMSAFRGERDKDDIGGYIYDVRFIFDSLRSRMFRIVGVFMLVLAGVFTFLYQGGLGLIKDDFISRIPEAIQPEEVTIIALHPVEVLIFIVKVSMLLAIFAVFPMILYYAWPAMEDREWISGNRNIIFSWTAGLITAVITGTLIGYFLVAPAIMSYLVYDALQAGMVISYRINSFSWLIIFTTIGVGLLAMVPFTMWMLYRGGFASYHSMRDRWREVTIASFVLAGMFTPATVLTMFIVGIPVMVAYWIGLAGLWLVTLGGRRGRYARPQTV